MPSRRKAVVQHSPTLTAAIALKRLRKLLDQITSLRGARGRNSPEFETWEGNIKLLLANFYGLPSPADTEFRSIWFSPGMYHAGQPESDFINAREEGLSAADGFLRSRIEELEEELGEVVDLQASNAPERGKALVSNSKRVFIVHGQDAGTKETVARFVSKLGLDPIILHELPDKGRTIIEKFEDHSADVACAVVILTPDDHVVSNSPIPEGRARQNVVLELGFFIGVLGRHRTFALKMLDLTLPSDMQGVIYIDLGLSDWQVKLAREFRAIGLEFDTSKLL
jgi:predicted nucleotide-binding protein